MDTASTIAERLAVVTPARDAAGTLAATASAILQQSLRPDRWIIVSIGSTDGTDDVAARLVAEHDWISLVSIPSSLPRDFAGKARALNIGLDLLAGSDVTFIACIDADVTFGGDHLECIVRALRTDDRLGIAGTRYVDANAADRAVTLVPNALQVPGGCQVFRRACLRDIGPFALVPAGTVDSIATTTARMKGWRTVALQDRFFVHHRATNEPHRLRAAVAAAYTHGRKAYLVGGHPLWEISRGVCLLLHRPVLIGGCAFLAGYGIGSLFQLPRPVSAAFVSFHRGEQLARLRSACESMLATTRRGWDRFRRSRVARDSV